MFGSVDVRERISTGQHGRPSQQRRKIEWSNALRNDHRVTLAAPCGQEDLQLPLEDPRFLTLAASPQGAYKNSV